MVVCIHAALENLSILRSAKKPCRDPQRAYAITLCQASQILLHFDIAPSVELCGDRSLREELQACEPSFRCLSLSEVESCWPPAEGCCQNWPATGIRRHNGSYLPFVVS